MKIVRLADLPKRQRIPIETRGRQSYSDILETVQVIVEDVRQKGDSALITYTEKFDQVRLSPQELRVPQEEIEEGYNATEREILDALEFAAANIESVHQQQLKKESWSVKDGFGNHIEQIVRPLSCVGIYVPGGKAPYPSTALMTAIPPRVAGVSRIVACSPPRPNGTPDPVTLAAFKVAGVDEVYRIGGAQAIAALAFGTETVPKVEKIVGPGNRYVNAAKLLVHQEVAIGLPAGPSEVLVLADDSAEARFVALDLLSQAEHGSDSVSVLVTPSMSLATQVQAALESMVRQIPSAETAQSALETKGLILVTETLEQAVSFANEFAPEHIELNVRNNEKVLSEIRNAGAVFLGNYSPVAAGDYAIGTNHVLPTDGYARIYSQLGVRDFVKTMSVVRCSKESLSRLRDAITALAKAEGMTLHHLSVEERLKDDQS